MLKSELHGARTEQQGSTRLWLTTCDEVPGAHKLAQFRIPGGWLRTAQQLRCTTQVDGGGHVSEAGAVEWSMEMIQALREQRHAAALRGSNRFTARLFTPSDPVNQVLSEALAEAGESVDCLHTYVVPLAAGEEGVMAGFDRGVRKNLRKTERAGVVVVEAVTDQHFNDYFAVIGESRRSLGLPMFPRRFWDLHRKHLATTGRASFYIAYLDGLALACLGAGWGEVWVVELLSGSADVARKNSHFAGEALKWRITCDAIQRGVAYYDLAGVVATGAAAKEEAILRYKRKFGGILTRIPCLS